MAWSIASMNGLTMAPNPDITRSPRDRDGPRMDWAVCGAESDADLPSFKIVGDARKEATRFGREFSPCFPRINTSRKAKRNGRIPGMSEGDLSRFAAY